VSQEQRQSLNQMMTHSPLDLGADIDSQRAILHTLLTAHPAPDDVAVSPITLGGVPALSIDGQGQTPSATIFFLHGGVFSMGSAEASVNLAADLGRRSGMRVVTVDYRLAPEHPFPAGPEDVLSAYRGLIQVLGSSAHVAVVGESAGGNLALGLLVALRNAGLQMPFAAFLMSPWVDLLGTGATMISKADVDPALSADALRVRARDYLGEVDPSSPEVSPIHADLSGLPPLLIQAGSHEILLDDATRLAAKAAAADVAVTLDVVPEVPHVFQAFAGLLDEGTSALDRAANFLRTHSE